MGHITNWTLWYLITEVFRISNMYVISDTQARLAKEAGKEERARRDCELRQELDGVKHQLLEEKGKYSKLQDELKFTHSCLTDYVNMEHTLPIPPPPSGVVSKK